jgi:uncharacterized protein
MLALDAFTLGRIYSARCHLGTGVFAAERIRAGTVILELTGHVITKAQTLAKGRWMSDPLQIGVDLYVDTEEPGVFINHSCDPNAGVVNDVLLVALRDIVRGEQIMMDYSTSIGADDGWTMRCRCGSPRCRGIVGSFDDLPADIRERYLARGVVQRFLRGA